MDVPMADTRGAESRGHAPEEETELPLSEKERQILELYDRLLRLELEVALTKARQQATIDTPGEVSAEAIRDAKDRVLEARASWLLRNEVVEGVMTVNPVIKAVHRGTDASPIERDVLPHVELRDEVSSVIAKKDIERQRLNSELSRVQVEALQVSKRNAELAAEVLALAEAADRNKAESIDDPAIQEEIKSLEQDRKTSRQKWKVMKGTASAVVAGSGVDWVKDADLRDIVLDAE